MSKKRTVVNKAEEMECQLCKQMISKYGMVMHIRIKHRGEKTVDEYVEAFGEFRQNKENKPKSKVTTQVTCELCNRSISTMGMAVHLRDTHNTTIDEYLEDGYSEFRPEKIKTNKLIESANGKFKCLICGNESSCEKVLSEHISTKHNLSKVEYIKTYILNDNVPLCKCGCGSETKIINSFPYYREFISGHNNNNKSNDQNV